jgi:hypothetical protein
MARLVEILEWIDRTSFVDEHKQKVLDLISDRQELQAEVIALRAQIGRLLTAVDFAERSLASMIVRSEPGKITGATIKLTGVYDELRAALK